MPRILRESASICFKLVTVSASYLSAPSRSSWVSARIAARGFDRSWRSCLRRGAEDLRGGALRLGVRRAEQDPPAPDSVLGPAYLEANGDELSVESDGGKVVDDRFG